MWQDAGRGRGREVWAWAGVVPSFPSAGSYDCPGLTRGR